MPFYLNLNNIMPLLKNNNLKIEKRVSITNLLPSLEVVAISQAPSPESNPNSPLPVITMVVLYTTIQS